MVAYTTREQKRCKLWHSSSGSLLGHSQNHLAVAGGCKRSAPVAIQARWLRTHPLPRGGSDCVQARFIRQSGSLVFSSNDQQGCGKLVEIGCHPILILNLLVMFFHPDDATTRVYDCLNVIGNGPVVLKRWQPFLRGIRIRAMVAIAIMRLWSIAIEPHPPHGMIFLHDEQPIRFQNPNSFGIVLLNV